MVNGRYVILHSGLDSTGLTQLEIGTAPIMKARIAIILFFAHETVALTCRLNCKLSPFSCLASFGNYC